MARTEHNKLVRDFIPERIRKNGDLCTVRTLDDAEFVEALKEKLIEEATELARAEGREAFLSEYADLIVVLDALTAHFEFSEADIKDALSRNVEKKGLFRERTFLVDTHDATT